MTSKKRAKKKRDLGPQNGNGKAPQKKKQNKRRVRFSQEGKKKVKTEGMWGGGRLGDELR